ncbi:MAG: hypothetical protein QM727_02875, partial [Niabella sp.]
TDHYCFYELILKDPLTMRKNGNFTPTILKVHCVADKCYGHNGATKYPSHNPDKKNAAFNYESLQAAYDRIHNFLTGTPIGVFPKVIDYLTTIEYHDGINWQRLSSKIIW